MADIQLTAQQRGAVEDRGGSLLVSAAAGSGKTKVLVERVFAYLTEEHCHIDDFLIITFTRAAAAELRTKLAAELAKRVAQDPENSHLRQQMFRVYQADIKTVDAFCTALLRENCHLLGEDARGHALRPDFRVLDENEAQVLRERVLARTLDDFYDRLTDGGALLADTLGAGRDDSALEALVLELHGKLQEDIAKDDKDLQQGPEAFSKVLAVIDSRLDKIKEGNDKIASEISHDIESRVTRLAKERGYTIVFNKVKVNVKADDITAEVIKELKKSK